MLMQDRAKYAMLISGLTFCALLITQQSSVFSGLMVWTTGTVRNIHAPIWVMDAKVERADDSIPMRQIEVSRVRSVPGVAWAVPLYWGLLQARLGDGSFQSMIVVGLDSGTLTGRPAVMKEGRIEDLHLPNAVVVDQVALEKFAQKGLDLKVGDTFEINDRQARVVGICETFRSFLGQPYVFTTFERALDYAPPQRKQLSYILAAPKVGEDAREVAARISELPGIKAVEREDFYWKTLFWYVRNTGIPISFGTVVILGIVVGVAIAGQTFYLFIHENLRYLGALKAMGARTRTLVMMVLAQSFFVGFVGYGFGVGLAAWFGNSVLDAGQPPFYMAWQIPVGTFFVIMGVCAVSALIGLRRVLALEAAVVFR